MEYLAKVNCRCALWDAPPGGKVSTNTISTSARTAVILEERIIGTFLLVVGNRNINCFNLKNTNLIGW